MYVHMYILQTYMDTHQVDARGADLVEAGAHICTYTCVHIYIQV